MSNAVAVNTAPTEGGPPPLLSAKQAAELVGVTESGFNRMVAEGRIPQNVQHPLTFGQTKRRKYIRRALLEFLEGADQ